MELILQLILAMILGGFIGLEREYHKHLHGIGIRTMALITIFGTLTSYYSFHFSNVYILISALITISIFSIYLFWFRTNNDSHAGLTSSITALIAFFLGIMINTNLEKEAVVLSIVVFAMLFTKKDIKQKIKQLTNKEIINAVEFAILAFVIFPFMPNKEYFFINLKEAWQIIVLISFISFIGFVLMRYFGRTKGTLLMSFFGSIVSTTAVIVSLVHRHKEKRNLPKLITTAMWISSSVLILRNMIFAFTLAQDQYLLQSIVKYVVVIIIYFAVMHKLFIKKINQDNNPIISDSPFAIKPALILGVIFAAIIVFSKLSIQYFGSEAFLLISFLGGMASGMATSASAALLFTSGSISAVTLVQSILIASIGGLIADAITVYLMKESRLTKEIIKYFVPLCIILILVTLMNI